MKGFFFVKMMRPIYIIAFMAFTLSSCLEKQKTPIVRQAKVIHKKVIIPPDTISIAAVGDIMLGTSYPNNATLPPDSGKSSFKLVEQYLRDANVAFGNLEGTLLDKGEPAYYKLHLKSKAYLFKSPEKYGQLLKDAGFDVLSLANNHIGDFGDPGRSSTTHTLDTYGIYYAGLLDHPWVIFEIKGIKYGFCSFAPNSQTVSIFDFKGAKQIISDLKKQCDIVIVSYHGGGEGTKFEHTPLKSESYFGEKRGNVYAFSHNAIDSGADIILGNGPHVNRAIELYKNRLIAYSLGNFYTYKGVNIEGVCGLAALLTVKLNKKGEFLQGRILSLKQTHNDGLKFDTLNSAAKRIKLLTENDFPDNQLLISDNGNIAVKY